MLLDPEDIVLGEDSDRLCSLPTVFQAECLAVVKGLENHANSINSDLTI